MLDADYHRDLLPDAEPPQYESQAAAAAQPPQSEPADLEANDEGWVMDGSYTVKLNRDENGDYKG